MSRKGAIMTRKNLPKLIVGVVVLVFVVAGAMFFVGKAQAPSTAVTGVATSEAVVVGDATEDSSTEQLKYLIEEEKLAHDVYTKMYELYGARVFGNILKSESTHQDSVLTLLNARGIADPRTSEVGTFNNTELQQLYDSLIAKGEQSAADAYEVGVAIEEKDIADISTQLETAQDEDIITTLESLRRGSENHLRAFNRQL